MSRIALYSRNPLSCLRKNGTAAKTVASLRESNSTARTNPRERVLKLCA